MVKAFFLKSSMTKTEASGDFFLNHAVFLQITELILYWPNLRLWSGLPFHGCFEGRFAPKTRNRDPSALVFFLHFFYHAYTDICLFTNKRLTKERVQSTWLLHCGARKSDYWLFLISDNLYWLFNMCFYFDWFFLHFLLYFFYTSFFIKKIDIYLY